MRTLDWVLFYMSKLHCERVFNRRNALTLLPDRCVMS